MPPQYGTFPSLQDVPSFFSAVISLLQTPAPATSNQLPVLLVLPFLEHAIKRLTQHAVFCVRLLPLSIMHLRFIHTVVLFLCISEMYSILQICPLLFIRSPVDVDIWAVSSLGLLWVELL